VIHAVEGTIAIQGTRVTIDAIWIEEEIAAMLALDERDEFPAGRYRITAEPLD
jgi:hypothetical protein